MKNKLQRLLVISLLFICVCFAAYQFFDSMIILTIFAEVVSFALCGYLILIDKRPATSKFAWLSAILFFSLYWDFAFFLSRG